jgi:hypothetical protein
LQLWGRKPDAEPPELQDHRGKVARAG